MKIKKIHMDNFRCFQSLSIHLEKDLNVIVGTNGAGKTSILEAIAFALKDYANLFCLVPLNSKQFQVEDRYDKKAFMDVSYIEPPDEIRLLIEISQDTNQKPEHFKNDSWNWQTDSRTNHFTSQPPTLLKDYVNALKYERNHARNPDICLPIVAYYSSHRGGIGSRLDLNLVPGYLPIPEKAFENSLMGTTNYDDLLRLLWLRDIMMIKSEHHRNGIRFADVEAVKQVVKVIFEDQIEEVFFIEAPARMMLRTSSGVFQSDQMSDGYRAMLGLVIDFATRLAIANPSLSNPLEAPGILLIDEVELHLHPTWQQRVLPDLKRAFPNTQIIVTTHSPQVLTTVENRCIQILRDQKLYSVPGSSYGAESQRMLQEVLSTNPRPKNEVVDELAELFQLIAENQLQEAQVKLDRMVEKHGPSEPAFIEAETSIKNRIWEKQIGL